MFGLRKSSAAGETGTETGTGLPARSSVPTTAPQARENIWERNRGIYFGYQCTPPLDEDKPLAGRWTATEEEHAYRGEGHIMTLGAPGTGKTRTLIMPNLARLAGFSIVQVDPKGTVCAATAVQRANRRDGKVVGDNIIVGDPFGVMTANYPHLVEKYPFLRSRGFNPIAALNPKSPEFVDEAKRLAQANIKIEERDSYWGSAGQSFVKGLTCATRILHEDASLGAIRKLIGETPENLGGFCKKFIELVGEREPAVATSLGRFTKITAENRELLGIIGTVATQTDWLDSKPVRADLAGPAYDFAQLKKEPITVYLVIPPKYLASHGTWLRIMVSSILMPLLRSVEDSEVPVLFMLDEFAQLGRLEVIQDNIALMREYGVKLWTIWQSLGQAKRLYGEGFEEFVMTSGVLQSFAARDMTTRDYLSKLSGQRLYWLETGSRNTSRNTGNEAGRTFGETEALAHMQGPEFWPHDLGAIESGQSVLYALEQGVALRSILPQPEKLSWAADMMAAARCDMAES